MKNKKGSISTILLDFWAYILYVLIVIIFYFLFAHFNSAAKAHEIISVEDSKSLASVNLLSFLKTTVVVDGNERTMAELISMWRLDPEKYKETLLQQSSAILSRMEYVYDNPSGKNRLVRIYLVSINSAKNDDGTLDHLIDFKSKSYESGFLIRDEYGRGLILAEQTIPVASGKTLYITWMEGGKADE